MAPGISSNGNLPLERLDSPVQAVAKKSYWEVAAQQLKEDDPMLHKALENILEGREPQLKPLQEQLAEAVDKQKQDMEDKRWKLEYTIGEKRINFRSMLDKILHALQSFRDVGSALAGLDPHAGIPWAVLNFVIAGVINESDQYAAMLDGLSQTVILVVLYAEIEVIYLKSTKTALEMEFEKCLTSLYTSILKYQVMAGCYCRRSTFSRFLRSIPKLDAWTTSLQNIKSNDTMCQKFTSIFNSQDQQIAQFDLKTLVMKQGQNLRESSLKVDWLVDAKKAKEKMDALRWLSAIFPAQYHRNALINGKMGSRYKDGGKWLQNLPLFTEWMTSSGSERAPLLLCGSVGAGKTSLVCLVIEWCIERSRSIGSGNVAYFYCSRREGQGVAADTVIRSLLWQLASANDSNSAQEVQKCLEELRSKKEQEPMLLLEDYSKMLIKLVNALQDNTIIIDALDECVELDTLMKTMSGIHGLTRDSMRLFVSGRNHINLSGYFEGNARKIDIGLASDALDIDFFIRTEVKCNSYKFLDGDYPALEDRLIETLCGLAQKNFTWAKLHLASFLHTSMPMLLPEDAEDKLDQLNKTVGAQDLTAIYDEIYQSNLGPGGRHKIHAEKCYQIVMGCIEPLKCRDLAYAVALNHDGSLNPNVDEKYVQKICSNLLVLDNESRLKFAHTSVIEYLRGAPFVDIYSDATCNLVLAELCLAFLIKQDPYDFQVKNDKFAPMKSFKEYAELFWPLHCQRVDPEIRRTGDLGQLLRRALPLAEGTSKVVQWLKELHKRPGFSFHGQPKWQRGFEDIICWCGDYLYSPDTCCAECLFVVCTFGFHELIDEAQSFLLKHTESLDLTNSEKRTPLLIAIKFRHLSVVKSLLKCGVDVEALEYRRQYTPLVYSIRIYDVEIFEALLDSGANIHTKISKTGDSVLHVAAERRADHIVNVLLKRNFDIETTNNRGETALFTAVQRANLSTIEILLGAKANAETPNHFGLKPLSLAKELSRSPRHLGKNIAEILDVYIFRQAYPEYFANQVSS